MVPKIAIIGGGFSGTMALAHLVKSATKPFIADWYEPSDSWGTGVAYGKAAMVHVLNVRASRMGAFAGNPQGFLEWLTLQPQGRYSADDFVPRPIYGQYLSMIVKTTLELAAQKAIRITQHVAKIESIKEIAGYQAVILACGTPPPRSFIISGDSTCYVQDPWQDHLTGRISRLGDNSKIGIIGTGLTAVDTILSIKSAGFLGEIVAFSRHGWLPATHQPLCQFPAINWLDLSVSTALELLRCVRKEIKNYKGEWHAVIDSIRPYTQQLWQKLPVIEQQKLLRHLFTLWNVHRHRMAPEVAAILQALQQNSKLTLVASRLGKIQGSKKHIEVTDSVKSKHRLELLINCTGPDFRVKASKNPLICELLEQQHILPDILGLGIELETDNSAKGIKPGWIYPLGAMTLGTYFEVIAVPELREQARQVALQILQQQGLVRF